MLFLNCVAFVPRGVLHFPWTGTIKCQPIVLNKLWHQHGETNLFPVVLRGYLANNCW